MSFDKFAAEVILDDEAILRARGNKNAQNPRRPYHWVVENERAANGKVEKVATIFLTNRECPFRCLMCDLWKNTLDETVPEGAILEQIDWALEKMEPAQHIKLYNSGNFFDAKAIPTQELQAIADRVRSFQTVIVENHPRLCNDRVERFQESLGETQLEVAMGLETTHPEVLRRLNKQMTLDDFTRAANRLRSAGIELRAFVLLRPPYLSETEGVEWALHSLQFAWQSGVRVAAVIPTRDGNGIMEQLTQGGAFEAPRLSSLETVMDRALQEIAHKADPATSTAPRVFVDLWDLHRFSDCDSCLAQRQQRLSKMNDLQEVLPRVDCHCENEDRR